MIKEIEAFNKTKLLVSAKLVRYIKDTSVPQDLRWAAAISAGRPLLPFKFNPELLDEVIEGEIFWYDYASITEGEEKSWFDQGFLEDIAISFGVPLSALKEQVLQAGSFGFIN